jgi:hypothetical protein
MNKTQICSSHLAIDDKMGIHAVDAEAHCHFIVKLLKHTNMYVCSGITLALVFDCSFYPLLVTACIPTNKQILHIG